MTVRLPLLAEQAPAAARPPLEVTLFGFPEEEVAAIRETAPADVRIAGVLEEEGGGPFDGLRVRIVAAHQASSLAELLGEGPVLVLSSPSGLAEEDAAPAGTTPSLAWPLRWRHVWRLVGQGRLAGHGVVPPPSGLAGMRVLAAEDDAANRLVLQEILELAGARLVVEENGLAACQRLLREGAEAFDLMITDLQMPLMDGFATAREVRRLAPKLPVIGLSAHVLPEERANCLAAGMVDLLTKPVSVDVLLAALAQQVPVPPSPAPVSRPVKARSDEADRGLVDWRRLEQCFARGEGFVAQLLATVKADAAHLPAALRAAVQAGDDAALLRISHRVAGMAANLMAGRLHDEARRVEAAAREAFPAGRGEVLALADRLEQLLAEIDLRVACAG